MFIVLITWIQYKIRIMLISVFKMFIPNLKNNIRSCIIYILKLYKKKFFNLFIYFFNYLINTFKDVSMTQIIC